MKKARFWVDWLLEAGDANVCHRKVKQVTGSCFTQPMRSDFEQIRKSDHFNQVVKMVKLETSSFRKVEKVASFTSGLSDYCRES